VRGFVTGDAPSSLALRDFQLEHGEVVARSPAMLDVPANPDDRSRHDRHGCRQQREACDRQVAQRRPMTPWQKKAARAASHVPNATKNSRMRAEGRQLRR
jgi:hypothetical protein